jgi:hypothetical protein
VTNDPWKIHHWACMALDCMGYHRCANVHGIGCEFGGSGGNREDIWALMGVPWSAMGVICLS